MKKILVGVIAVAVMAVVGGFSYYHIFSSLPDENVSGGPLA